MKGNLLQGTARGRMGEIVAKVRHGVQIFAKYQPNVFNPNSTKQGNQRIYFANAIAVAKEFINNQKYANTWASLRNSSRSLFVNITQLTLRVTQVLKGANGIEKTIQPVMQRVINDNFFENKLLFESTGEIVPTIDGVAPTSNVVFFGSNSEIKSSKVYAKALTSDAESESGLRYTENSLVLSGNVVEEDNLLFVAKPGFQNSAVECGNWPFVYSLTLGDKKEIVTNVSFTAIGNDFRIAQICMFTDELETIGFIEGKEFEQIINP